MELRIFKDEAELSLQTAKDIAEIIGRKPESLLCFAAGHTQLGTYRLLAEMVWKGDVDFSRCRFIGLDEWTGMNRSDKGSCADFMYRNVFLPLGIDDERICFFDGKKELEQECILADKFLETFGPVRLMLLGLGMNGHLGLNEPGTPSDSKAHITGLDPATSLTARKYFDSEVKLNGGVTLGLSQIMEAGTVILQASGAHKAEIVSALLSGADIPAGILDSHKNAYLFIDESSAPVWYKK